LRGQRYRSREAVELFHQILFVNCEPPHFQREVNRQLDGLNRSWRPQARDVVFNEARLSDLSFELKCS
jgi:hypothetical protein